MSPSRLFPKCFCGGRHLLEKCSKEKEKFHTVLEMLLKVGKKVSKTLKIIASEKNIPAQIGSSLHHSSSQKSVQLGGGGSIKIW